MTKTKYLLAFGGILGLASGSALAQFDELQNYGDGRTDAGGGTFVDNGGGSFTITAGGGDFWGNSDNASFLTASDGSLTTTSDFTATARMVSLTDPSTNDWGRDPLMVRAQPATGGVGDATTIGNPSNQNANSAHYMAMRRSGGANPDVSTGWRNLQNQGTTDWARNGGPGFIEIGAPPAPEFLSVARSGGDLYSGHAADLSFGVGAPVPGRWLTLHSTNAATGTGVPHGTIGAGTEVTVGVGHQSHNAIPGGNTAANTATWDEFNFDNGNFDASKFGSAAADYVPATGALGVSSLSGEVHGRAYTFENGSATGEAVGWKVQARKFTTTYDQFGVANSANSTGGVDIANDLVPDANFRRGVGQPGLNAEIFLGANDATNRAAAAAGTLAGPDGTTVIPNVWWNGPGNGPANGYPDAGGIGGNDDHGGANGTNAFAVAVPGQFTGNQNNYGVQMTGEVFIPASAVAQGYVAFKDGVDDYTYLEVNGTELINDNDWTGMETTQNQGGRVSVLDTSGLNPAGEWVDFRMVMWEGGGGDTASLYWDVDGTSGFNDAVPKTVNLIEELTWTGTNQIGDDLNNGSFGVTLPEGEWTEVTLMVLNTGGMDAITLNDVNVIPEPSAPLLIAVSVLGLALRRRRK